MRQRSLEAERRANPGSGAFNATEFKGYNGANLELIGRILRRLTLINAIPKCKISIPNLDGSIGASMDNVSISLPEGMHSRNMLHQDSGMIIVSKESLIWGVIETYF